MNSKTWRVIGAHQSEYPEPISVSKGALLTVGERYEGEEDWPDWLFCHSPGQQGGWVPAQLIETMANGAARAREDYTARELDVQPGDRLRGARRINGWIWCERFDGTASGWVPLAKLEEISE